MADIAKFIEDIKALSVLELNELVKAIENEFGVSALRSRLPVPRQAERLRLPQRKRRSSTSF